MHGFLVQDALVMFFGVTRITIIATATVPASNPTEAMGLLSNEGLMRSTSPRPSIISPDTSFRTRPYHSVSFLLPRVTVNTPTITASGMTYTAL